MTEYEQYLEIDQVLSFIVIDTENKSNKELKLEIYKRVKYLIGKEIDMQLKELGEDGTEFQSILKEEGDKLLGRMVWQFNSQIDLLVP